MQPYITHFVQREVLEWPLAQYNVEVMLIYADLHCCMYCFLIPFIRIYHSTLCQLQNIGKKYNAQN